jgi:hypothetical protein
VIFLRHAGRDFENDFIVETGLGVEANTVFMPLYSIGAAPTMCKRLVRLFQITVEFKEIVPPFHRQGNGILLAAIRYPDGGNVARRARQSDRTGNGVRLVPAGRWA